jgi:hypothetical protein
VNDIVISHIYDPHQTVVVLAGDGYVALELYFAGPDPCEESRQPDEVVLLGTAGAQRLAYALVSAAVKSSEAS